MPYGTETELGSSPLTRGKRRPTVSASAIFGLIPAHAGKTERLTCSRSDAWAHPRSRGENRALTRLFVKDGGSSPLTRGKPTQAATKPARSGLIPAHAGKTFKGGVTGAVTGAHPRSRGENRRVRTSSWSGSGSSPLTRGKLVPRAGIPGVSGLIPAHAGKTLPGHGSAAGSGAHPRSRGENVRPDRHRRAARGSSPLTRGKPHRTAE